MTAGKPSNEVHAASHLQMAWARVSILAMLVGACWIIASVRFAWGAPQIMFASGLFFVAGLIARFMLVKPPITTIRVTPTRIELDCANGTVRSVKRDDVENAYVRGRTFLGFVVPRNFGVGHAQLLFGTHDGHLCFGNSISWMRTQQVGALLRDAGITWSGATSDLSDPTGLPPAIWPPTIPKQAADQPELAPATIAAAKRINSQTLIAIPFLLGGFVLAFTLDNYLPRNHAPNFIIGYVILYAAMHFMLNTLITTLSRRRAVTSLARQNWWPCEVITSAPPKERYAHGVHFSGRIVQFVEAETGRLSAPYLIAPGHRTDWLEPTQRVWTYCTGNLSGDKMLIAPPDRSSIAYASFVVR